MSLEEVSIFSANGDVNGFLTSIIFQSSTNREGVFPAVGSALSLGDTNEEACALSHLTGGVLTTEAKPVLGVCGSLFHDFEVVGSRGIDADLGVGSVSLNAVPIHASHDGIPLVLVEGRFVKVRRQVGVGLVEREPGMGELFLGGFTNTN